MFGSFPLLTEFKPMPGFMAIYSRSVVTWPRARSHWLHASRGESLVVVDPWDNQVPDTENAAEQDRLYPDVSLEMFKANFQKFHVRPADMRRGISSVCLPALGSSNYRFIHVDGSHEWDQVKADVEQVLRLLGPNGVVAFDECTCQESGRPYGRPVRPETWPDREHGQALRHSDVGWGDISGGAE